MKLRKMIGILLYSLIVATAYCIPGGANGTTIVTIGATLIKPLTLVAETPNPTTHITTEDLSIVFEPVILTATGTAWESVKITTPSSIDLDGGTSTPVTVPVSLEGGVPSGSNITKSITLGVDGSAQTKLTIATTQNLANPLEVGTYTGSITVSRVSPILCKLLNVANI